MYVVSAFRRTARVRLKPDTTRDEWLIYNRPLGRFDDDHVHGGALRVEAQSELLFDRGKQRRPVDLGTAWRAGALVRCPLEIQIEPAGQTRAIDDEARGQRREVPGEIGKRHAAR